MRGAAPTLIRRGRCWRAGGRAATTTARARARTAQPERRAPRKPLPAALRGCCRPGICGSDARQGRGRGTAAPDARRVGAGAGGRQDRTRFIQLVPTSPRRRGGAGMRRRRRRRRQTHHAKPACAEFRNTVSSQEPPVCTGRDPTRGAGAVATQPGSPRGAARTQSRACSPHAQRLLATRPTLAAQR